MFLNKLFYFALLMAPSLLALELAKPGSILVKRKPGSEFSIMSSVHAQAHATTVQKFIHPSGLELVQVNPGSSVDQALAVYKNDPNVEYAEPNYVVHALGLPNDTYLKYQWGLNNVGQTGGVIDADINAPLAWDRLTGSDSIVLGTIDTGVDYNHPDLINNIWTNSQEIPNNGIDDDNNGYVDDVHGINAITGTGNPMDDNVHGTHVAGIMGAQGNNGLGISGVMQKTKIIACKFLDNSGSGDTAGAISCMNYFAALARRSKDPVKVVATNNSWGGGLASQAFTDAVKVHQKLGILFMAAASNESNNNDINPTFPSSIALSNVITVAATDQKNALASFSNYGKHSVLVAAPGVNILSTVPNKQYNNLSGTSMATPFVTGMAGFIKASQPDIDWVSLKNLIIAGGKPIASAAQTTVSGRLVRITDMKGQGSLSCNNQLVMGRLLPKANAYTMTLGQSLKLSVLKINCALSTQPKISAESVQIQGSLLNDTGTGADDLAYDGVFNGYFKPTARGSYILAFPNGDNVSVTVR